MRELPTASSASVFRQRPGQQAGVASRKEIRMPLMPTVRSFIATLLSRDFFSKRIFTRDFWNLSRGATSRRGRDPVPEPETLRTIGPFLSMGPKATVVEAQAHGRRYILKQWNDLPPNGRRDLLRLIRLRADLTGHGYLTVVNCGEKQLDRQSGYIFCVQEYRSRSLRSYLAESPGMIDLASASAMVAEIARRLQTAHSGGIVHGNLSPEAVYVETPSGPDPGNIYVDFVRFTGSELTQNPAFTIAEMFPTGRSYLSPESLLGNPPDELSDLYTLGILAYEIFTKKLPFGEESASRMQTVRGMLSAQVRPLTIYRQDIPPRWQSAILRLLTRDRKQRFLSATDFLLSVSTS